MKATDILSADAIKVSLESSHKKDAIRELALLLPEACGLPRVDEVIECILKREEECSTAVGHGVALPHAQIPFIEQTCLAFGKSKDGIPFNAPDDESVKLIFLLVGPKSDMSKHLMLLATLSRLLSRESVRKELLDAETPERILEILAQ